MTRLVRNLALLCAAAIAISTTTPATAQTKKKPPAKSTSSKKKPTTTARRVPIKLTAIIGADIYTVSKGIIRRGTIIIGNDKIVAVGQNLRVLRGTKIIRAEGKYISPGFVTLTMSRVGLGFGANASRLKDGLNPFDRNIKLALASGITTGCSTIASGPTRRRGRNSAPRQLTQKGAGFKRLNLFPGIDQAEQIQEIDLFVDGQGGDYTKICKCCGLAYLPTEPPIRRPTRTTIRATRFVGLKMSYGSLDNMVLNESPFIAIGSRSLRGATNRHAWRLSIKRAKKYVKDLATHAAAIKAGKKVRPPRKTVSDSLIKLVKKEIYLRTFAFTVDDIRDMIALAKELDYKVALDGAYEGWVIPQELGRARVPVIITPRRRLNATAGKEDRTGTSIESSGIFEKSGVSFAVTPLSTAISLNGLAGRDLTSLSLEAAFAVRGGASEKTSLASITLVPAQIMGVADRIGSIDAGKDADILILNGPPLDYRTYVETAIVNGRVCYERAKDKLVPVFKR